MTEKRYELKCHDISSWYIEKDGEVLIFNLFKSDGEILYAELNSLSDKNEQLKQFQEQVAEVIESKMGDNVCNDYKMEVLKEIWNELELDGVWFE